MGRLPQDTPHGARRQRTYPQGGRSCPHPMKTRWRGLTRARPSPTASRAAHAPCLRISRRISGQRADYRPSTPRRRVQHCLGFAVASALRRDPETAGDGPRSSFGSRPGPGHHRRGRSDRRGGRTSPVPAPQPSWPASEGTLRSPRSRRAETGRLVTLTRGTGGPTSVLGVRGGRRQTAEFAWNQAVAQGPLCSVAEAGAVGACLS